MKRSAVVLVLVFCVMSLRLAQIARAGPPAQTPTTAARKASQPKFKAIFEPVNCKQDLTLSDVFFVSKDEGWVAGSAGTILHTKDGGNRWTAELGGDYL